MNSRLLEGEGMVHKGIVYIVKGYQHPENYVIAYPRYNLLLRRKLRSHEAGALVRPVYWNCIMQWVPLIPLNNSCTYTPISMPVRVHQLKSVLEALLDSGLHLTGSALITEDFHDVDFVVYGATNDLVDRIKKLVEAGVFKRDLFIAVDEYTRRHSSYMHLLDYLYLKKNTILHFNILGVHVNLRLVEYERGYSGCRDPVLKYHMFTGKIRVLKQLNPHIIPARYIAIAEGEEVILESMREAYAELEPGEYYVYDARIEERKSGLYLVPDSGVLLPLC